jgi:phage terminase large subunit-like protein
MPTNADIARYRTDPMAFAEDLIQPTPTGDRRFGEIMADFQRERFARLAADMVALQKKERPPTQQHWWEATKGASKDTDLAVAVIWLLTFSDRPLRIQIGAADREQAAELRLAANALLNSNTWLSGRLKIDRWVIRCPNTDATAEIIAADVAGSHGSRPDVLILNELHAITDGSRVFAENMMDNATKVPYGLRIIATNAGFRNTWQWTWRENARLHPDRWYFAKFDVPAPWIAQADLEEAERRNSRTRYLRLWRGVWCAASGDALDEADIAASQTMTGPHDHPMDGYLYGAGLDLAVKRDHASLVIVGAKIGYGRVAVASVRSWKPQVDLGGKIDLRSIRTEVQEAYDRWGLVWCGYDPHQAALMAQDLEAAGCPMTEVPFVGRNLDMMASTLMQVFRGRTIDLYPDPQLLDDLSRLTIEERRFGYKLTSVSDEAGHADRAIALAIALPTLTELANLEYDPHEPAMAEENYRVVA